MFCTHCGAQLEDGARFCSSCGAAAAGQAGAAQTPAAATAEPGQETAAPPVPAPARDDEGGVRGWYHRHQEAARQHEQEEAEFHDAAQRLTSGDDSEPVLAELSRLRSSGHHAQAAAALTGYVDGLIADDVLTEADEARLAHVCDTLGVSITSLPGSDLADRLAVARINDGRLPRVATGRAQLMARAGETVFVEVQAALMKEVVDREFRGGSRGVSIPIYKGVRYRTASYRGHSVVVGSHLEPADTGTVSVSSARIVFLGQRKTIETPIAKLASTEGFADGIRIHASNRQTAPLYHIPSGAHVVAAVIQSVATGDAAAT